ncbi:MAG: hypothetical protein K9J06_02855 [Flavobacteriales bacterium]|nr:hypothetical protein [Flavobacteriales bacterium]
MSFSKHLGASFIVLLLLTLLTDPVWGFYEGFAAILISGTITNGPLTEFYFYGAEPLGKLLAPLHGLLPMWPWMGVAFWLSLLVSLAVTGHVLDGVLQGRPEHRNIPPWAIPLLMLPAYGFVITELSGSSVSFLTTASAMLGIWHLTAKQEGPIPWGKVCLLSVFYITGYFSRIDSALGGTFIALLFIGIVAPRPLLPRFKALLLPGTMSAMFLLTIAYEYARLPFLSQIEPYIFYVTDSRFQPPVDSQNAVDSVKVEAIKYSFFNDTSQLNLALFERLVDQKSEAIAFAGGTSARFIPVALSIIGPSFATNQVLTWVFVLIMVLALWLSFREAGKAGLLRVLMFNVLLMLTIMVLAYFLKMEKWHYVPMLQTGILFNLVTMVFFGAGRFVAQNRVAVGVMALVSTIVVVSMVFDAAALGREAASRAAVLERVQGHRGERTLYLDANAREILNGHVFRMYRPMGRVLLYDQGQLSMIPQYRERLDSICGCRSAMFTEFMDYMGREGKGIMILSSDGRTDLLSRYASTVHGMDIRFIPEADFESFEASGQRIRAYFAAR